ncbi:hypothetical protein [Dictyobacter aurantiacus]|uniref:Uncharacterized protein n=1 Tax=Dictyobacter aurantiacus TaxID=1936993 RepID=A0A401Z9G2_9CHLR|nr:hypothetical protein [Dictyobacter aurantiacus]GCE03479.1 hypothetical protein KDAU_08080 [Dictyobacter aurantiacus]
MLILGTILHIHIHHFTNMFPFLALPPLPQPSLGGAANPLGAGGPLGGGGGGLDPIQTELTGFLSSVKNLLTGIGATIAVIGVIIGGLMRATAFGNERKVAISNQAIACAIVGLAIVLIANTAVLAIQGMFR